MRKSTDQLLKEAKPRPWFTAMWMERRPSCNAEETRKRVIWSDKRNIRYNKTDKTDRYSKQYQLRSTYRVLNRNSGGITFQQHTNHFHVTIPCSNVNWEITTLFRGRNEKRRDKINDIARPTRHTDHLQNNINSGQLTLPLTETVEGSHSNKQRTTSTSPFHAATWMGRLPSCYEEKTRKTMIWTDMRNKRYNKTDKTNRSYSKQYQLRSTYLILNKNSGGITLQQHTNHFNVTIPSSMVDGKVTILSRGRNEKESDMNRWEK